MTSVLTECLLHPDPGGSRLGGAGPLLAASTRPPLNWRGDRHSGEKGVSGPGTCVGGRAFPKGAARGERRGLSRQSRRWQGNLSEGAGRGFPAAKGMSLGTKRGPLQLP